MEQNLESIIIATQKAEEETNIQDENGIEKEVNPELKELMWYSNEINKNVGKYDTLFFIEPKGVDGISYEEEFKSFFEKIEDHLDEEEYLSDDKYSKMCPTFTYPEIENQIDEKDLESRKMELKKIEKKIEKCENENVSKIAFELLELGNAKIDFHKYLRDGDLENAFECSKIIWGDIDDDLCQKADEAHKQKIEFLKNKGEKTELENILENNEFNAEDIKHYFELAITKAGLGDSGYEVVIDNSVTNLRVSTENPKYDHPVVLIPPDRKVNGVRLLELIAHEIGRHVVTNIYNEKQGFKETMGKDWNVFNEGISLKSEREIKKVVFGDSVENFDYDIDHAYYILAMEKIKDGWNFAKVFKFLYDLSYEEELYKCKYYDLENKYKNLDTENEDMKEKIANLKKKSREEAIDVSKKKCLRVFRGFNPKEGEKYCPKDTIYFRGEVEVSKMEQIEHGEDLEKYLRLSRVDPKFIPYLIKMNAYVDEKGLEMAKDVATQIWQGKGWPVDYIKDKEWYEENIQMDRHWAYRKEFMNEDMTGLKEEE